MRQEPVKQERPAAQQTKEPSEHVQQDPEGSYCWLYCMDMKRHARWFGLTAKIIAVSFVILGIVAFLVTIVQGDASIWAFAGPLLGGAVMIAALAVSWGIYMLISGGKYWGMFIMDSRGVTHRPMNKTYNRLQALSFLAFVMADSHGARSAAIAGMRGAAWHMDFSDVKMIVIDRAYDMIGLKGRVFMSSVYASPEDYGLVLDHIKASVPRDTVISEQR